MRRVNPIILSTVSFAALSASPAFAQDTKQDTPPPVTLQSEQEAESGQDAQTQNGTQPVAGNEQAITVTGSRIRRPNLESPLPVTSVGGQEFFETGDVSVGDKLAELPSIASTFTQANSTRFLGTAGLNLLDLRGLGTARTLVLVNGRRHVGGDVLSSGVSTDVNTIPTDLIDRVDVVTGGNSAVYGSDAIAGVVNFVLKQDYDGIQLRAQGGQSKYGDADSYFISALVGQNFGGGRGNVAVNLEYARRDQAWGSERSWLYYSFPRVNDIDADGVADGNPDNIIVKDFHSVSLSNTGTLLFGGPGTTLNCGLDTQGHAYSCPFIFQPDGTLVPVTGNRGGVGPNGFISGPSNGEDFVNGHQVQITPQLDRYSGNLVGHYEISPALVPFVEATFSRTDSVGAGGNGPAFMTGTTFGDPAQFFGGRNRERIRLDNPFVTDQARGVICDQRALLGLGCTDATQISVRENMVGLGNRTEEARRDTYRIVGGLRGDIGGSWNYEASINYGHLKERTKIQGNLNVQRFLLANDAVTDPTTGNVVCRSQIDPNAAFGYYPWVYGVLYPGGATPGDPNGAAVLAADVAACTPINPLGGNFTQAQRDYLLSDTVAHGTATQFDATAFISGDTSGFFELPGGPVGVVLGAEYRTDDMSYKQDPLVSLGYTFYNAIPSFSPPKQEVKEAFGELRVPILKDVPLVHELEVSGAARVSDYKLGTTGTVWAYNVNGIYSPFAGLRLRGNYARAVRAPNQVELFTPLGQNFTPGNWTDPCDVASVGAGSANRPANCLAAGVPAGQVLTQNYGGSIGFLSGGSTNLEAEKSDSITVGGVFTPTFLPGASLSVDYYSIKIGNVITAPTAQQVFNACYDSSDLNNPYCALFQRAGAAGSGNTQPYGIIGNSLHLTPLNYAKLRARGLDIEAAYRHQVGSLGRLDTRFTWTHALELTQWIDPTDTSHGDRLLSELGNPKDAFNWNTSLQHGRFTVGYQMRYIGRQTLGTYESAHSFEGRAPEDADFAEKVWWPSRFYHDVRLGIDVGPKYNFYMGVDNLTNTKPPNGLSGIGGGSGIYDAIGRFYYAGVKANFK
jgi:outer membrane receptor protein involved in Fe transport